MRYIIIYMEPTTSSWALSLQRLPKNPTVRHMWNCKLHTNKSNNLVDMCGWYACFAASEIIWFEMIWRWSSMFHWNDSRFPHCSTTSARQLSLMPTHADSQCTPRSQVKSKPRDSPARKNIGLKDDNGPQTVVDDDSTTNTVMGVTGWHTCK